MYWVIKDALIDTAKMVPLLFLIYMGIEYVEYKFGPGIREKVKHAGKAGPMLGAAFGSVPQCGFSVISTALYTRRLITVGTLLAVYLSTSDEAIPVILAQPEKIAVIFPLLATKIVIAIVAGYSVDFIFRKSVKVMPENELCATVDGDYRPPDEQVHHLEEGCCGHNLVMEKPNYRQLVLHPVIHTAKVFVFIFAVSLIINYLVFRVGEQNLGRFLFGQSILQPLLVGVFGLIPNCAASVAITEVFLKGGISFGSAVAGLCSSAGLGMLVLLKENSSLRDTAKVIGMLLMISVTVGIGIQYFYG